MRRGTVTAWTEIPIVHCPCTNEQCPAIHAGDDIFPDRFAFWVVADRKGTYYATHSMRTFTIELTDMQGEDPYQPGEALVMDLATGDQMDAAAWMARP